MIPNIERLSSIETVVALKINLKENTATMIMRKKNDLLILDYSKVSNGAEADSE
jgi:hypothetical protein